MLRCSIKSSWFQLAQSDKHLRGLPVSLFDQQAADLRIVVVGDFIQRVQNDFRQIINVWLLLATIPICHQLLILYARLLYIHKYAHQNRPFHTV